MAEAAENYLKAIFKLRQGDGRVSTTALAEKLGVSPASATNMVDRLTKQGLVWHEPYRGVVLTENGERAALEIIRHHRLWELYLTRVLRLPIDEVHQQAEQLEHALSDTLEDRLDEALGFPTVDPHGDPIPTKNGALPSELGQRLTGLAVGASAVVERVPDSDPNLLRYLGEIGLLPGATITLTQRAPFGGPLYLRVGAAGGTDADRPERIIGQELAERILVTPADREAIESNDAG